MDSFQVIVYRCTISQTYLLLFRPGIFCVWGRNGMSALTVSKPPCVYRQNNRCNEVVTILYYLQIHCKRNHWHHHSKASFILYMTDESFSWFNVPFPVRSHEGQINLGTFGAKSDFVCWNADQVWDRLSNNFAGSSVNLVISRRSENSAGVLQWFYERIFRRIHK